MTSVPPQRVLVVEDDPIVADVVVRYLDRAGFVVECVGDGHAALASAAATPPALVVLDLMLPGVGGLEVCRALRASSDVAIVMLTALGEESDRIAGLEVGADDYITKPFSPRELVLRVQSVLRRVQPASPGRAETLTDADLTVDAVARAATLAGVPLALTAREFDLLAHFLRHPRRAFSRDELLKTVWDWTYGDASTVTVHVRRLREKIEPDPSAPTRIQTVWGVGYRYEPAART